jgi:hypothetical protein
MRTTSQPFFQLFGLILLVSIQLGQLEALAQSACHESQNLLLHEIDFTPFQTFRPMTGQSGTADLLKGKYQGREVVIKYRNTSNYPPSLAREAAEKRRINEKELYREAQNLIFLNSHGIGVRFLGFTRTKGDLALIIEKVQGPHAILKEPNDREDAEWLADRLTDQDYWISKNALIQFEKVLQLLEKHQIVPVDLQFLLTKDGELVLIDPEGFQPQTKGMLLSSEKLISRQRENFQFLFKRMQRLQRQR